MKKENPRKLALSILDRLDYRPIFSQELMDKVFRRNNYLDDKDRAFIHYLVLGVLRWRLRLDWIIEEASDFPLKKISPSQKKILSSLQLTKIQSFLILS